MMLEVPVQQVIPRLAVPTIISMLISSIYNMADTYFVSQLGTSASGAVGAYRWAESILGQYLADGRDTASARAAGAAYAARYGENDAALRSRLETVQTAAETLASGQELGLVRDRRLLTAGWESGEVDALFAAIAAGAGIE